MQATTYMAVEGSKYTVLITSYTTNIGVWETLVKQNARRVYLKIEQFLSTGGVTFAVPTPNPLPLTLPNKLNLPIECKFRDDTARTQAEWQTLSSASMTLVMTEVIRNSD